MESRKQRSSKPYLPEFRKRAVRLAMEHRDEYSPEFAALASIAENLGCSPNSLSVWVRQAERDGRDGPRATAAKKARFSELEREVRELHQADDIPKLGEPVEAPSVQAPSRPLALQSPAD